MATVVVEGEARMQRYSHCVVAAAFAAALLGTGCSTGKPSAAQIPPALGLPPVGQAPATGVVEGYRVRAGDELRLKFLFHKELDGEANVREDGQVTIAGLGDFHASGLTTDEIEEAIYRRASLTYRDPEVAVVVERQTDFRAYIGGEVRRPGFVPLRDGMTSLRAIFESGGFLDTAKVDHVLHVRWSDEGAYSARVVDLKHVLETGDMKTDIALNPNDVVFVPKTAIANADLWVRQYLIDLIPLREPTTRIDDFR
jgi:protein involved in polysaccharide export with SLBB domain